MLDYPDQLVFLSSYFSSHSLCRSLDLDELVQDSNLRLAQSSLTVLVNRVFALLVQFELSIVPFVSFGCSSRRSRGSNRSRGYHEKCSQRARCSSQAMLAQPILKFEWVTNLDQLSHVVQRTSFCSVWTEVARPKKLEPLVSSSALRRVA